MRFLNRSFVGMFLFAASLGFLGLGAFFVMHASGWKSSKRGGDAFQNGKSIPSERLFAANVVTIRPERIQPEMQAYGEILSRRVLELRSPAAGQVVYLAPNFRDGAPIQAGQLLIGFDAADGQTAYDLASVSLQEAQAGLDVALRAQDLAKDDLKTAQKQADLRRRAFERQQGLESRNVVTSAAVENAELAVTSAEQVVISRRSALDQAKAQVDQSRILLRRSEISYEQAKRRLADTKLYAGFGGYLDGISLSVGTQVNANERLGDIIDLDQLEVAFRLSNTQFSRLLDDKGQMKVVAVKVRMEAVSRHADKNQHFYAEGFVSRSGASVSVQGNAGTGRRVYANLPGARAFRPGDFVSVTLQEPVLEGVARIPVAAIDGNNSVLLLGSDDRLEALKVDILRYQGNDILIDAEGLSGRELVLERSARLGAGIRIRPLRQDSPQKVGEMP